MFNMNTSNKKTVLECQFESLTSTTKKLLFYDVHSNTVILNRLYNRLRKSHSDSFVIKENEFFLWCTF